MTDLIHTVITPSSVADFSTYHALRFNELRKPWLQPIGSEIDNLESVSVHRMICDENGQAIAVGRFHKTGIHTAQVRFMAVDSNHQGKGLGRTLLLELESEAARQGVKTMQLNAREVALDFYLANGYMLQEQVHTLYDVVKHFSVTKRLSPTCMNETQQQLISSLKDNWDRTIPAAKAQGITPVYLDHNQFSVCAPRDVTVNLHNTMFAGSLYTLATLTGWGWIHCLFVANNIDADIVLADGNIRYKLPLVGEPLAKTEKSLTSGNFNILRKGRKARIAIQVNVYDGDQIVAEFNGKFVAIPKLED